MCTTRKFCNQLWPFWPFFSFLVNSTCSTGSKYDVDLLRADVGQCKARVQKLKRELVNMDAEVRIFFFTVALKECETPVFLKLLGAFIA